MFYGIFNYLSSMVNSKYEKLNPLVKLKKKTELCERVDEQKESERLKNSILLLFG